MSLLDAAAAALHRILPATVIGRLKRARNACLAGRDRLFSADLDAFRRALVDIGVQPGAILYVRSAFDDMRSLRATPTEIIRALAGAVGEGGTVVMPTYPWGGLAQEYLDRHLVFDVRRTASSAGMLTEVFRRMPGARRSLHPTHPLAALGARASWLTEGHERSDAPFDEQSPFQRLLDADALVLSIGRFDTMTLRHFADHQIRDLIAYPLYTEQQTRVELVAADGRRLAMLTRANNPALG